MSINTSKYELAPYYNAPLKPNMTIADREKWVRDLLKHFWDQGVFVDEQSYRDYTGKVTKAVAPLDVYWGYEVMVQKAKKQNLVENRPFTKEEWAVVSGATGLLGLNAPEMIAWTRIFHPVYSLGMETLGTDNSFRCMIGPWFFDSAVSPEERQTLLCHELFHPIFGHTAPGRAIDPEISNIAGDVQINQGLRLNREFMFPHLGMKDEKGNYPKGAKIFGVFPDNTFTIDYPDGLPESHTYEWYYGVLLKDAKVKAEKRLDLLEAETKATAGDSDSDNDVAQSSNTGNNQGSEQDKSTGDGSDSKNEDQYDRNRQDNGSQQNQSGDTVNQNENRSASNAQKIPNAGSSNEGDNGQQQQSGQSKQDGGQSDSDQDDGHGEHDGQSSGSDGNAWGDGPEPTSRQGNGNDGKSSQGQGQSSGDDESGSGGGKSSNGAGLPFGSQVNGNSHTGCDGLSPAQKETLDKMGIEKAGDYEKVQARNESLAKARAEMNRKGSNSRGLTGSGFTSWYIKTLRPPIVPWKKLFRNVLSRTCDEIAAGRSDYSFRRPRRRQDQNNPDVVHPGIVGYVVKIVFGIDQSGSMGEEDNKNALSEIQGAIKKIAQAECKLVTVDTKITNIQTVKDVRAVKLVGGGGTIMRKFYDWIDELGKRDRPDVTVLATDGEIDWDDCYDYIRKDKKARKHIILVTSKSGWELGQKYPEKGNIIKKLNGLRNAKVILIDNKNATID